MHFEPARLLALCSRPTTSQRKFVAGLERGERRGIAATFSARAVADALGRASWRVAYVLHKPSAMTESNATGPRKSAQLRRFAAGALVGILTLGAGTLTVRAEEVDARWQPTETIAAAAREAAIAAGADNVEAVAIDERLKMNRCAGPLDAKVERPIARGDGTIAVSCSAACRGDCSCPCARSTTWPCSCSRATLQPGEVLTSRGRRRRAALVGIVAVRLLERRHAGGWPDDAPHATRRRRHHSRRTRSTRSRAARRARHVDERQRGRSR